MQKPIAEVPKGIAMDITLTPELDRLIHERIATGMYGSVEDVLTAALRALSEDEQTVAAIAEGYDDFLQGRYRSLEEADSDFRNRRAIPRDE